VCYFVNKTNLVHNFIHGVFINVCMFRATMGPSSGEPTVFMRHSVLVNLCGWLSRASSSPKHVEIDKYIKNKIVTKLVLFAR
jgi:hypothetical protein